MTTAPLNVVAAVIERDGLILACRRAPHVSDAGRWEFPGGKVKPGETPEQALVREIAEELGVVVRAGAYLTVDETAVGQRIVRLICLRATLNGAAPVTSTDHDELRWVGPTELATLEWAAPDLPAVRLLSTSG